MKSTSTNLISLALVGLAFVMVVLVYPTLPAVVPIHWTLDGSPDRYAPKFPGVFFLPAVMAVLYSILTALAALPSGGQRALRLTTVATLAFLLILTGAGLAAAKGASIVPVAQFGLGALSVVLGALLRSVPRNPFFGVRTPATQATDEAWRRTNRMASTSLIVSGSVAILGSLWKPNLAVFGGIMLLSLLLPSLYSLLRPHSLKSKR